MGMVMCNTFFKKEDSKQITYQSGDNRSMIDYLMVRKTDRCLVKDVKVISSEECVTQHRMVRLVIALKPQKKKIVRGHTEGACSMAVPTRPRTSALQMHSTHPAIRNANNR